MNNSFLFLASHDYRLKSTMSVIAFCALILLGACDSETVASKPESNHLKQLAVATADEMDVLDFHGVDKASQTYWNKVQMIMREQLEFASFSLILKPIQTAPPSYAIVSSNGLQLFAIHTLFGGGNCTLPNWVTEVAIKEFLFQTQGGKCGHISTIHSLVKLKVLSEKQAFTGGYIREERLREVDASSDNRKGMTITEVEKAHVNAAPPGKKIGCTTIGPLDISNEPNRKTVCSVIDTLMNHTSKTYDCTALFLNVDAHGKKQFGHIEQVKSISKSSAETYELETTDAFDQGKSMTTVPKNSGTNKWRSSYGLTRMTKGAIAGHEQAIPPVNKMAATCCTILNTP